MLHLDGFILHLDVIHHEDVANVVDAILDVLLVGYPNDDATRSFANLRHVVVPLLLPTHHPILDVDAAITVHLATKSS